MCFGYIRYDAVVRLDTSGVYFDIVVVVADHTDTRSYTPDWDKLDSDILGLGAKADLDRLYYNYHDLVDTNHVEDTLQLAAVEVKQADKTIDVPCVEVDNYCSCTRGHYYQLERFGNHHHYSGC